MHTSLFVPNLILERARGTGCESQTLQHDGVAHVYASLCFVWPRVDVELCAAISDYKLSLSTIDNLVNVTVHSIRNLPFSIDASLYSVYIGGEARLVSLIIAHTLSFPRARRV